MIFPKIRSKEETTAQTEPLKPDKRTVLYKVFMIWHGAYAVFLLASVGSIIASFWNIYTELGMSQHFILPIGGTLLLISGVFYLDYHLLTILDKGKRIRLMALSGLSFSFLGPCLLAGLIALLMYSPLNILIQKYQ